MKRDDRNPPLPPVDSGDEWNPEAWDPGEWKLEIDGPMTFEKAIGELRVLYDQDDEFSPYLLTEPLPDGLLVTCKDGTELRITVAVRAQESDP